jgi:hypothetical protein
MSYDVVCATKCPDALTWTRLGCLCLGWTWVLMASKRRCAAAMQTLWSAVMQRESRTRRRPETVLKPTPGARQRAHDILVFAGSSTAERTTVIARSSSRNKYTRKLRSPLQHAGQGQGSTCSTFILVVRQPFWFGVSRRAGHSSNRSRSISAVPDDGLQGIG